MDATGPLRLSEAIVSLHRDRLTNHPGLRLTNHPVRTADSRHRKPRAKSRADSG
jgi:hypothetical protein